MDGEERRTVKHSNDAYLPVVNRRNRYGDIEYYLSDTWRSATTWMMVTSGALGTLALFLTLFMSGVFGWTFIAMALPVLIHIYLYNTYDLKELDSQSVWMLRYFFTLPKEVQAEMGGRDGFVRSIEHLTWKDAEVVVAKMKEAKDFYNKARATEAKLRSSNVEIVNTLDRYGETQKEYIKTLKELS